MRTNTHKQNTRTHKNKTYVHTRTYTHIHTHTHTHTHKTTIPFVQTYTNLQRNISKIFMVAKHYKYLQTLKPTSVLEVHFQTLSKRFFCDIYFNFEMVCKWAYCNRA